MISLGSFVVFLFQLSVGPTASDARQFALLKGEWQIVRAISEGVELPAKQWSGKKVSFVQGEVNAPKNSATLAGRLRTKGNMAWLETHTITLNRGNSVANKVETEYSTAFQVDGKNMKLLLTKVSNPSQRGPRPVEESKGEGGILLYLKRR